MNKIFKYLIIFILSTSLLNANEYGLKDTCCEPNDIKKLLFTKDLDPLSRNKKIWKRLLRRDNFLKKYGINPHSPHHELCIKQYILDNAFDLSKYSRELGR